MTGRERWVAEAKKIQVEYRKGAKKCVEKLLQGEQQREKCEVPLKEIEGYMVMVKEYSSRPIDGIRPTWIEETTDCKSMFWMPH